MFTTQELNEIRKDFPILNTKVRTNDLVYLDNAATTQKPLAVINAVTDYYCESNANVHRGVHHLSEKATALYEDARQTIAEHLNADKENIVFTRGTTEAINLVAHGFAQSQLQAGDEVLITELEHHSNIVPWQLACQQTGAKLVVAQVDDNAQLILEDFKSKLSTKTKLVAITAISNALGVVNPIKEMIDLAHEKNIPVLIDAAQALPHQLVDVKALNCDFLAFSGHKVYGPTGIGVLYAKTQWLEKLPPYQGGGEMIIQVSFEKSTFHKAPFKFEAGTPNIAGAVGLAQALHYIKGIGVQRIQQHEQSLLAYATEQLSGLENITIIGQSKAKASVISFTHKHAHPHDMGTILDDEGIAVRAGHHCAMPLMEKFGLAATVRASMCLYTSPQEVDRLVQGIKNVEKLFS
jgi:cysteine desulfurase / selenocysteine lyase